MDAHTGLVEGLKSGEVRAQEDFWKLYWPETYAICAHILGNGPNATDVAVDLLSDFITKHVHQLSHPKAHRSYLRVMAMRRSLRFRENLGKHVPTDMDSLQLDSDELNPEEAAHVAALMPRLDECLGELTTKAQQAIRLRYDRQMTNEKIGGLVGGSKQYVGRLLRRSLELLRKCLESGGVKSSEV
ncbi:MAG: sigma-70 family RNA polymerase sigma factor [Deltaproteobacteria bacterium]|nr:sigma-70 family RNA polymerase sigma factor [Deltaproteobacteria bacterium]